MEDAQARGQRPASGRRVSPLCLPCPGCLATGSMPHGREYLHGPMPTHCFLGCQGLGWSCSRLEVSHLGHKVKRARAPHRRGHPQNQVGVLISYREIQIKATQQDG